MSGAGWDGYTEPKILADDRPVAGEFARLWPPGTPGVGAAAGGDHQAQPSRTVVYDDKSPPGKKKKKRRAKPVPGEK